MIYPDTPLSEWVKRYKLATDKDWDCPKCGKVFPLDQPIMMRGMAGLSTRIHECGKGFWSVLLTPATPKSKAFWRSILSLE